MRQHIEPNNIKNSEYKIPIVIGTVGHMDIGALNADIYENFVLDLIDKISNNEKYKGIPLIGMSALAKGADRIFTRAVLRAKIEKNVDIDLYCPLPLEKELYVDYLKYDGCSCEENKGISGTHIDCGRNSVEEFEYILKKAKRYYFGGYNKNINAEQIKKAGVFNDALLKEQFERISKFIADSSDIMLAFWDGNKTDSKGRTYFALSYKLSFVDDKFIHDTSKDLDLNEIEYLQEKHLLNIKNYVVHILVEREKCKDFALESVAYREINSSDKKDIEEKSNFRYYNNSIKEINLDFLKEKDDIFDINSEINNLKEEDIKTIKKSKKENFQINNADLDDIANMFSVFDHLALKHQKKHKRNLRSILWFGIAITVAILIFYHLALTPYMPLALLIIFSFISLSYFIYNKFINPLEDAVKYIHFRVAAELLRLQYYFNILNMNKCVTSYYSGIIEEDKKWISLILKTGYAINYKFKETINKEDLDFVTEKWINNQKDKYFDKKIKDGKKTKNKFKIFQKVLITAFFLIIFSMIMFDKFYIKYNIIQGVLIFSNIMFILYLNYRGFFEDSRADKLISQYKTMKRIYEGISSEINKTRDLKDKSLSDKKIKTLIYILGKEAIRENKSWAQYELSRSIGFKF